MTPEGDDPPGSPEAARGYGTRRAGPAGGAGHRLERGGLARMRRLALARGRARLAALERLYGDRGPGCGWRPAGPSRER